MSAGATSSAADRALVRERCETVLRENWREGVRVRDGTAYAYTCPSPGHYPWQWYWDSCFTAIARRHLDPERARRELASLLAAGDESGFIGHTIFWEGSITSWRRVTYNVLSPKAAMTASIQPPALAWAWSLVAGDPAREPGILAHHRWLAEHRDLDGDGLLWIVQPDESGLDASTQFDPIWRRRAHGLPGFVGLVRRNRRLGFDLARIAAAGGPVCCEVLTNVIWNLSRIACGEPSLTETLIERLYDAERGAFLPLARVRGAPLDARIPTTIAALTPLALPDLPEEIGHRLAAQLLDPGAFHSPVAPPSVSLAEPSFSLGDGGPMGRRYWRGPTWVNTAWLCWRGLRRLGYRDEAAALVRGLAGAVAGAGLREYYHPYTGAGMGAREFGWSALMLDMVAEGTQIE